MLAVDNLSVDSAVHHQIAMGVDTTVHGVTDLPQVLEDTPYFNERQHKPDCDMKVGYPIDVNHLGCYWPTMAYYILEQHH